MIERLGILLVYLLPWFCGLALGSPLDPLAAFADFCSGRRHIVESHLSSESREELKRLTEQNRNPTYQSLKNLIQFYSNVRKTKAKTDPELSGALARQELILANQALELTQKGGYVPEELAIFFQASEAWLKSQGETVKATEVDVTGKPQWALRLIPNDNTHLGMWTRDYLRKHPWVEGVYFVPDAMIKHNTYAGYGMGRLLVSRDLMLHLRPELDSSLDHEDVHTVSEEKLRVGERSPLLGAVRGRPNDWGKYVRVDNELFVRWPELPANPYGYERRYVLDEVLAAAAEAAKEIHLYRTNGKGLGKLWRAALVGESLAKSAVGVVDIVSKDLAWDSETISKPESTVKYTHINVLSAVTHASTDVRTLTLHPEGEAQRWATIVGVYETKIPGTSQKTLQLIIPTRDFILEIPVPESAREEMTSLAGILYSADIDRKDMDRAKALLATAIPKIVNQVALLRQVNPPFKDAFGELELISKKDYSDLTHDEREKLVRIELKLNQLLGQHGYR